MTANQQNASGPISGFVVGQFFGLFNGMTDDHYNRIVSSAPFEDCNLLILAFVHTVLKTVNGKNIYVADFNGWRDNNYPHATPEQDRERARLVAKTARAKNPSIKILVSLGWGNRDAGLAAKTPADFADSVAELAKDLNLDGFDIDYEDSDPNLKAPQMLALTKALRESLSKITPKREVILTITPAYTGGLDKSVLEAFTYVMPQSYDHGGNGTTVDWYEKTLGSFNRIVYGMNSEGWEGDSDKPDKFANLARENKAAGVFAWRLDNDTVDKTTKLPKFVTARALWNLLHPANIRAAR